MKYLIAYQQDDSEDQEFENLIEAIYSFDETAINCFGNVWLVDASPSIEDIKTVLCQYLEMGDRLIVATVQNARLAGFDPEITAWITSNVDE